MQNEQWHFTIQYFENFNKLYFSSHHFFQSCSGEDEEDDDEGEDDGPGPSIEVSVYLYISFMKYV